MSCLHRLLALFLHPIRAHQLCQPYRAALNPVLPPTDPFPSISAISVATAQRLPLRLTPRLDPVMLAAPLYQDTHYAVHW